MSHVAELIVQDLLERLAHDRRPRLNIALIGPSRVGKTTMLGSMVRQFNRVLKGRMRLRAVSPAAKAAFAEKIDPWREILSTYANELPMMDAHPPTKELTYYLYELEVDNGLGTVVEILFVDMPGKWFENEAGWEWRATSELVYRCDALLVPIDVPALRSNDYEVIEHRNGPDKLERLFQSIAQSLSDKDMGGWQVLLTPIRCERWRWDGAEEASDPKWMQRSNDEHDQALRHWYAYWLDLVATTWPATEFVLTPVQTVGTVVHSRTDGKFSIFAKKSSDVVEADPVDTEQPLLHILDRVLQLQQDNLPRWWRPSAWWNGLFGVRATIEEAKRSVEQGVKHDDGFGPFKVGQ